MLQALKTYLIFGKQFCGVEIHNIDNVQTFSITELVKQKKELQLKRQFNANTIDGIATEIPKKQHVFLIVNDTNVLFKKINSNHTNAIQLVNTAFPNINLEELYYEISTQKNNNHFIAISRKQHINNLITDFQNKNIYVTAFSLGNSCITEIKGFVANQHVSTSNATIEITDCIKNITLEQQNSQKQYNINGLETFNTHLLSLSGALNSFLKINTRIANNSEQTTLLTQEYTYVTLFSKTVKIALISILTALLINFFYFNYYFNTVKELQVTAQVNQSNKNTFLSLNEKLNKKQKVVDDILKSNASKSSFYTNAIIKTLPKSILLSEFNFQPLHKKIKKAQNIQIANNVILIKGVSSKSELFSNWIDLIENLPWIKNVEIIAYSDLKNRNSEFALKLNLINE